MQIHIDMKVTGFTKPNTHEDHRLSLLLLLVLIAGLAGSNFLLLVPIAGLLSVNTGMVVFFFLDGCFIFLFAFSLTGAVFSGTCGSMERGKTEIGMVE